MARAESLRVRAAGWVAAWWEGRAGPTGSALNGLLLPAELGYRAVIRARNEGYDRGLVGSATAPIPVVSVGNIGVGGAGKTPFAAWVAARFASWGCRPAIAIRGYGGDEVLVHRELNPEVPVFVDRRRIRAAEAAAAAGGGVVVLDDGFQHRQLERDLDLLLVSAEAWAGSRKLLPRGPWREGIRAARRADLVIAVRKTDTARGSDLVERDFRGCARVPEVVSCSIEPAHLARLHSTRPEPLGGLAGQDVLAVAALASPTSFRDNLRSLGARVELAAFPDHHEFTSSEASALLAQAGGRPIALTLKDAVKLRRFWDAAAPVFILHQTVRVVGGADLLETALRRVAAMVRR